MMALNRGRLKVERGTRSDLRSALTSWQSSRLSAPDIHRWAEARFGRDAWECEDEIANEVLAQLDVLEGS
jgi:hypothetical protein